MDAIATVVPGPNQGCGPADRLYLAVLAVACLDGVAALAMGKHQAEYNSVLESLGLAGMLAGQCQRTRTGDHPGCR